MWNLSFPQLQNKIIQIRKSEPNGSLLFSSTLPHQQRQHPQPEVGDAKTDRLSEFAFASSFGFLFAFYRRLLIMLSFTNFVENASACALSLKSSQSTIQRLVIFDANFCHTYPSLRHWAGVFKLSLTTALVDSATPGYGWEKPVTKKIILYIGSRCQAFFK